MAELIFNEQTMLDGSIFQFEQRLKNQTNRYVENGVILTTYFSQDENASTVDRGFQDIDQLFGSRSPMRFHQINNFPLLGFGSANPQNTDEQQVEDVNVEGEAQILPGTIVPKPMDHFMVNHMEMAALFQVTSVSYDSMKPEGYYKIQYRLLSTEQESIDKLKQQTIGISYTELDALGTSSNPIITEDDFLYRRKVQRMVNEMIQSYRAMYYNERHNCFLFYDQERGEYLFDPCGNHFMMKHSLVNCPNGSNIILLGDKLQDPKFPIQYRNSVYAWLEMDAPASLVQKFYYTLTSSNGYLYSSFYQWNEEVKIMHPMAVQHVGINNQDRSIFDQAQLDAFLNSKEEPLNASDALLWKYMHRANALSIHDVPLTIAHALWSSVRHMDTFRYTPILIYIIRKILRLR